MAGFETVSQPFASTPVVQPADPHPVELAGLLHELTASLISAAGVRELLDRLAAFTIAMLPGALRCSVTLIGDGAPMMTASAGSQAKTIDDLQYTTGQGPGLDAARTRSIVLSDDLARDDRWPALAECAQDSGVHTVAAVPMDVQRNAIGSVTIYLARPTGIDSRELLTAMAVVGQAEVLLGEVLRRTAQDAVTANLVASLRVGAATDHAIGVIVAQRGVGVQEAYAILVETAQQLGMSPRLVAERLVHAAERRGKSPGAGPLKLVRDDAGE